MQYNDIPTRIRSHWNKCIVLQWTWRNPEKTYGVWREVGRYDTPKQAANAIDAYYRAYDIQPPMFL